jgi:4-amino-4-deoxy-L-arabinose transferase-like glycosyltransferase
MSGSRRLNTHEGFFVTRIEKYFWPIVIATIVVKLFLAYDVPIVSDEAYFYVWGQHWDLNYYDHPPMTGWLMVLFSYLGQHIFFSRLISIISGLVIAWGVHKVVRDGFKLPDKAKLACLTFVVSPLHVLFVIVTTDTPVFLFVFMAGMAFFYARRRNSNGLMLLTGTFWGMAVISKYFAVLLMVAFAMALVYQERSPSKVFKQLALITAGALPFLLVHLYGSYTNCWTNYMFNVINRNRHLSWKLSGFLWYLVFQIYLATPWALYYLLRRPGSTLAGIRQQRNVFAILLVVPLVLFGLIAFHDTGLHWTIAYWPFLALILIHLERLTLKRIVIWSMVFSLLHVIPIVVLLSLPVETYRNNPKYHDLVLGIHGAELYQKIRAQYGGEPILATNGYYTSAVMTYFGKEHVIVFLDDSKHGRYDDKLTDFRQLDGKDILILSTLAVNDDYTPYFDRVSFETITLKGNAFNIIVGRGFHYQAYRDLFLAKVRKKYYAIPHFLPVGDCYFFDMYFQ